MKLCAIGLIVCCSHVYAQSFVNNPVASQAASQNAANAVAISQSITANASRTDSTSCIPMILVGDAQVFYIDPKEGHAPSWYSGKYDRSPSFQANTLPFGNVDSIQSRTERMQIEPWSNGNVEAMKIASSSSSSSASSYVNQWSENGKTTTESTAETEVTVNGKTYRTFKHDIQTTPNQPPQEPQSYNERIILCR
jgi:hypothetical protein